MARSPDTTQCPVCGEPYDRRILVQRGDGWDDLFPGTALEFFRRYRRRCSAATDVEAETPLGDDELAVYFHGRDRGATVL